MSVSTKTSLTLYGSGSYSEAPIPTNYSKQQPIPRLYPVLEDCSVRHADVENLPPSVPGAVATSVCAAGGGGDVVAMANAPVKERRGGSLHGSTKRPSVVEYEVKWKGLTAKQILRNLMPVKIHYKMHLLFQEERRGRYLIANEEFTEFTEIHIQCVYGAPIREELLHWEPSKKVSRHMLHLNRLCRDSSKVMSLTPCVRRPSVNDDTLHTPRTHALIAEDSIFSSDSRLSLSLPKADTVLASRLATFDDTLSRNLSYGECATECKRHRCSRSGSCGNNSVASVLTVTRRLTASEETVPHDEARTPPKKDADRYDSLVLSLAGTSPRSDNSLERSIGFTAQRGADASLDTDGSLERSINDVLPSDSFTMARSFGSGTPPDFVSLSDENEN
ncbi:hypothetical protein DQ04_00091120 [Trypanosoma grayi]|uniref:hypothetical protein n=1 Tax=Trypanosoma grayi TaxID=71804 RepID=UPI0004F44A26|nr:hypothetical protein DQ04_00091120 [Trypanosoma grayi]KEG15378.1 hypothetical protein DQ04_00091120 [Trypanosoma grayi]